MPCAPRSEPAMTPPTGSEMPEWIGRTLLVRECRRRRVEIERHKWYESERAGYDIGWDRAEVDWLLRFGAVRNGLPDK